MITIPYLIKKNGREYKLLKIYKKNKYVLYEDIETKTKICFSNFDLGLISEKIKPMRKIKIDYYL